MSISAAPEKIVTFLFVFIIQHSGWTRNQITTEFLYICVPMHNYDDSWFCDFWDIELGSSFVLLLDLSSLLDLGDGSSCVLLLDLSSLLWCFCFACYELVVYYLCCNYLWRKAFDFLRWDFWQAKCSILTTIWRTFCVFLNVLCLVLEMDAIDNGTEFSLCFLLCEKFSLVVVGV
jgi:hypothetical protein